MSDFILETLESATREDYVAWLDSRLDPETRKPLEDAGIFPTADELWNECQKMIAALKKKAAAS
jgi:hypothetical protein